MTPFNSDNSRLLLQQQSYFALYDGQGQYLRDLPFEITAASEPRWSRHDANLLYYVTLNQLKQFNTATGAPPPVHTFAEYTVVNGRGESDICFDGDHLVLVGNHQDVFVYDISTDTKGPVLATTALGGFDNVPDHAGRSRPRELVRERRRPLPGRRALRLGHGVSPSGQPGHRSHGRDARRQRRRSGAARQRGPSEPAARVQPTRSSRSASPTATRPAWSPSTGASAPTCPGLTATAGPSSAPMPGPIRARWRRGPSTPAKSCR